MPKSSTFDDPAQSRRFEDMARELGVDESPESFDSAFLKVARHKPKENVPEPPKEP